MTTWDRCPQQGRSAKSSKGCPHTLADQNGTGPVALRERVEVLRRLIVSSGEIASRALLFDDQDAGPEEIDVSRALVQLRDMRFVPRHCPPPDTTHVKELVVEALRLPLLVCSMTPLRSESGRPRVHLVPRQAYSLDAFLVEVVLVDPLDLVAHSRAHADVV